MTQVSLFELVKPLTQSEKILEKLKAAGKQGVSNRDLNSICYRYAARIHELRKDGYNIKAIPIKRGLWRFILS